MKKEQPPLRLRLRKFLSPDGFAMAPMWIQLVLIITAGTLVVLLFGPLVGSLENSFRIFMGDPEGYVDVVGRRAHILGFVELIIGLCVSGFIISILTSALIKVIREVLAGTHPYRGRDHILIINENTKTPHILGEMNEKYHDLNQMLDVVILLRDKESVFAFTEQVNLADFPYLNIFVKQGNPYRFDSYKRHSILSAIGLIVLLDKRFDDPFKADNDSVKIISILMNQEEFQETLLQRFRERNPYKFAVELNNTVQAREIALSISILDKEPFVNIITPLEVISHILSRSIIDICHYRIFDEIFSFFGKEVYFVDPGRFIEQGLVVGMSFEEMHVKFTEGTLIGLSHARGGAFKLKVAPFGIQLREGDWLIFIAETENDITFNSDAKYDSELHVKLEQPSEIASRRICMIGDRYDFSHIDKFLDSESTIIFHEGVIVLDKSEEYFNPDLISLVKNGKFDHVIINLDDETALRFSLYVLSVLGPNDPFLGTLITVIEDPVNDEVLSSSIVHHNTILSEKLAAKYITQLAFQKSLDMLFNELTSPEGYEFNLLPVAADFPKQYFSNQDQLKSLFLNNRMLYTGMVGNGRLVHFEIGNPDEAEDFVVISSGNL